MIGNRWITVSSRVVALYLPAWGGGGEGGVGGVQEVGSEEKPARHKLQAVIFMMTDETGYWNPGGALGLRPPFAATGHGRLESGSPADLTPTPGIGGASIRRN